MPPEIANHVAAVTLFGKPSAQWLQNYGAPAVVIGPLYAPKTDDLCADGDTICNGDPGGLPSFAHSSYPVNGMTRRPRISPPATCSRQSGWFAMMVANSALISSAGPAGTE